MITFRIVYFFKEGSKTLLEGLSGLKVHMTLKFSIIFYGLALKCFKILDENCLLFVTIFPF